MDRSITQRFAYQQLIKYKRGYKRYREDAASENTINEGTNTNENEKATHEGIVENAYQRFSSISHSTAASNKPSNVYVHSKLFLYLGLLERYDDLLSPPSVHSEKETNQPTSSSLPLLLHYSHVWLIDHDINLHGFNLTNYLQTLHTARFPSPSAPGA